METFTFSPKQEAELQEFLKSRCGAQGFEQWNALWYIVKTVVENSHYGSSEYGGPVCFLDFRINNLKKLFPDTTFFSEIQDTEKHGAVMGNIEFWLSNKLKSLIPRLGLNNVIIQTNPRVDYERVYLFSSVSFLVLLKWCLFDKKEEARPYYGDFFNIYKPDLKTQSYFDFSGKEMKRLLSGDAMTSAEFPNPERYNFSYPFRDFESKEHEGHKYYKIQRHFSKSQGFVIPETDFFAAMIRVIWDLMEGKSQDFEKVMIYPKDNFDGYEPYQKWPYSYPQLPSAEYPNYSNLIPSGYHFQETSPVQNINTKDGSVITIKVNYPEIDPQYGQWWHRQFPPKTYWQELPE